LEKIKIAPSDRVFVLTGAGISAESGLPTFRASDGLWAGHRVEDVCSPEALDQNPELVWQFYSERREQEAKANPNPAHTALAELESKLARLRPHIVFFGEIPLDMGFIQREIDRATLMIVVGTSGSVYPAANFVHWARQNGARTVYIGPEPPLNAQAFTNVVEGKAGEVMPGLFEVES
jgi:NAD-dependent SIR2 family protein deacetylase